MSTEKKDYLPYIHVYYGPKNDQVLRFRATDEQGISKCAKGSAFGGWEEKVIREFNGFVDPRTLNILRAQGEQITNFIRRGVGTVWVTPTQVQIVGGEAASSDAVP